MTTHNCILTKVSAQPKWITISYEEGNDTVTELTANEPTFKKPKTRNYPKSVVGKHQHRFAALRILGLLSDGWSIQKEHDTFSSDRLSFQLPFNDAKKLNLALDVITAIPASKRPAYADWKPVLQGSILCSQVSPTEITLVMLPSAIDENVATRISAAMRCASDAPSVFDFLSDPFKVEPMLKLHRRYDSLGDDVLDRFNEIGINLRPASFGDLTGHQAYVGF